MAALIFLAPFPHITSIQELCFYPAAGLFVVLLFKDPSLRVSVPPLSIPFAAFTVWAALGLITALDFGDSLRTFWSHWLRYLLFFYMVVAYFRSPGRFLLLVRAVAISAALFSLGILIAWYGIEGHPLTSRLGHHWTSIGTTINGFMTVWGVILAWGLFRWDDCKTRPFIRRLYLLCALVCLVASLMSQSRGTILALIVSLFILLFRHRRLLLALLVIVSLFVMATPLNDRFTNPGEYRIRIGLMHYTVEILKDYPLTGIGFSLDTYRDPRFIDAESYMSRLPEAYRNPPHPYWWPHNMILNVAVRTGIVGLGMYLFFLATVAWMAVRLTRGANHRAVRHWGLYLLASLAMYLCKSMFDPVFTHFCDTVLYTNIALVAILWHLDRQVQNETPERA